MVRALGKRHYDVQLMGGIVLHRGAIAEMRTGEGKTFVAPLAAYLNALVGRGVHVVTVNDYLAKRDAQWIGAVFHRLGMSVGCIQHEGAFVFDPDFPATDERLRDLRPVTAPRGVRGRRHLRHEQRVRLRLPARQPGRRPGQRVQRGHFFAIVDEVDNILIDEARTPLIISGQAEESADKYLQFAAPRPAAEGRGGLRRRREVQAGGDHRGRHRQDGGAGSASTTCSPTTSAWPATSSRRSRPQVLYQRDRDYVVKDGEVIIVDEFTGRLMPGRRWSEGLHQAVEAKEGVKVRNEQRTLATVTFQNYFRMYDKLAGMTGTAETEAEEFRKIYDLEVVVIPTHRDDDPRRLRRPRLRQPEGQVERGHRRDRRGAREGPAGAGRHDQRRGQRDARRDAEAARDQAQRAQRQAPRDARPRSSRRPAAPAPSPSPRTWPAAAPTSSWAATPRCWPPTCSTSGDQRPRGVAGAVRRGAGRGRAHLRRGQGEGARGRRPAHPRHRAPRGAPHRQPAARPRRPPGRPGQLPLLPVARGRPDAALRERPGAGHHAAPSASTTTRRSSRRW